MRPYRIRPSSPTIGSNCPTHSDIVYYRLEQRSRYVTPQTSMSLPRGTDARIFYRAAKQRFSDAQLLLKHNRTTSAVYLAGYGIECMLKALLLESVPESQHVRITDFYR